jgi:diacylglycerol kinase family enzyme
MTSNFREHTTASRISVADRALERPVMPEEKPARIAVLLNQAAGNVLYRDGRTLRETLAAAFERRGMTATLEFLSGAEMTAGAERALHAVQEHRLDAVVAGGGDGSIASVAGVLAATSVPLGILPLGTFNHFAKDLGIPLRLEDAVDVIAAGHLRSVDLGEVNGETFVNNSSIGIYPYLVVGRERLREQHGLGKWTAMALATWRTLRHFPLRRLRIRAGNVAEPYRSPCVFIGNNEYCLTGRVAGKRERLDAGELCVYVAKRQTRFALFWLACRSLAGFMDQSRDLRAVKAADVEITSRTSRLLVALDGEVAMMRTPLRYRARPDALRVFAPEPAEERSQVIG